MVLKVHDCLLTWQSQGLITGSAFCCSWCLTRVVGRFITEESCLLFSQHTKNIFNVNKAVAVCRTPQHTRGINNVWLRHVNIIGIASSKMQAINQPVTFPVLLMQWLLSEREGGGWLTVAIPEKGKVERRCSIVFFFQQSELNIFIKNASCIFFKDLCIFMVMTTFFFHDKTMRTQNRADRISAF